MRKIVVAALAVAAFAALGLTQAAIYRDSPIAGKWFLWLVVAHGVLAAALLLAAAAAAWKLAARRRRRVFGSSLSLNLAGWFALMAAAPALLLYGVAAQGIFRGIESWFDAPLGEHFEKGIDLSRRLLGREINRLDSIARNIAAAPSSIDSPFWLDDLRLAHQLESIVVYDSHGIALAASPGGGAARRLCARSSWRRRLWGANIAARTKTNRARVGSSLFCRGDARAAATSCAWNRSCRESSPKGWTRWKRATANTASCSLCGADLIYRFSSP